MMQDVRNLRWRRDERKPKKEENSPGLNKHNYCNGCKQGGKLPPDHQSVRTCLAMTANLRYVL